MRMGKWNFWDIKGQIFPTNSHLTQFISKGHCGRVEVFRDCISLYSLFTFIKGNDSVLEEIPPRIKIPKCGNKRRKAGYDKSKESMLLNKLNIRNQVPVQAIAWENSHYYVEKRSQSSYFVFLFMIF
jgi:hypothetical protein